MKLKRLTCILMALLTLALSPGLALAQDAEDEDTGLGFGNIYYIITGISVGGVTTAGVLVVLLSQGGVATTSSSSGGDDGAPMPSQRAAMFLDEYIKEHPQALRDAAALGAGPALDDLMQGIGMPKAQRASFSQRLRGERAKLEQLISSPASLERGYQALALLNNPQ